MINFNDSTKAITEGKKFHELTDEEQKDELFKRGPFASIYELALETEMGADAWNVLPAQEQTRLIRSMK